VSRSCAPFAVRVFVVGTMLPSIGEVSDPCIEYRKRDVGGEGGVMEDTWFESSVCICTGQCAEGIILVPPSIPIELLEFCQVFGEVGHFLVGVAEALDFSS